MAQIFELSRMTINRFAKQVGKPVSELDMDIVKLLVGHHRDLRKAYKDLGVAKALKLAASKSGLNPSEILQVLALPRRKHECFAKDYNFQVAEK